VDHGAAYVSTETSQRLACDASLVHMRHDGALLAVSRKTRTIPPSIRRALAARDTSCRYPGCTSRRCDAHHVQHWADGGATRLDNLVLLCRRHHRAVHEGGFTVIRGRDGALTFLRPGGAPLEVAPASPRDLPALRDATPDVSGTPPTWDGTPFDLPWAIDVLYRRELPAPTV
jgi:HNH endonuclease